MRCPNCRFDTFGNPCQFCGWDPNVNNSSCSNCGFLTQVYESRISHDYISKSELRTWCERQIAWPVTPSENTYPVESLAYVANNICKVIMREFCGDTEVSTKDQGPKSAFAWSKKEAKELIELREWKEKATPFLEEEYNVIKQGLEAECREDAVHPSLRSEWEEMYKTLTGLLGK